MARAKKPAKPVAPAEPIGQLMEEGPDGELQPVKPMQARTLDDTHPFLSEEVLAARANALATQRDRDQRGRVKELRERIKAGTAKIAAARAKPDIDEAQLAKIKQAEQVLSTLKAELDAINRKVEAPFYFLSVAAMIARDVQRFGFATGTVTFDVPTIATFRVDLSQRPPF